MLPPGMHNSMTATIIQFVPRPNHARDTDFPTITFKTTGLAEQAKDILTQIEGTQANAIWGNDKEPA